MTPPTPGLPLTLLAFFLVIGVLVFVHEMGHYLAGRWFGVKAEAFSIGFGREVLGWTDKLGTRWKVGWLPLGGYVKFKGDMSPASEPDPAWIVMPAEERNACFQAKPLWQRAIIVAAGPAINFLFAILIFAGIFIAIGEPRTTTQLQFVQPGSPAAEAGLRPGDRILAVDGDTVDRFEDLNTFIRLRPGERVDVLAQRGGGTVLLPARIGTRWEEDRFDNRFALGYFGVSPGRANFVRLTPLEVPGAAARATWTTLDTIVDGLGQIITGRRSVRELGGPLKIAQVSGERATFGWIEFVYWMALISINLGFINLLPVPMLDGGHLLFYAVAAVRRKALSPKTVERAFRGGLALMLALMVVVTFNDLASFGLFRGFAGLIGGAG